MPVQVIMTRRAENDLDRLDPQDAQRILRSVRRFADTSTGDAKPLRGQAPLWRLRVGQWRVLFVLINDVMRIERILHRRDAYR